MLLNLEHRGACGCEENTGDGAGILIQMPHRFLAEECDRIGIALPAAGPLRRGHGLPAPRRAGPRAVRGDLDRAWPRRRGMPRPGLARRAHRQRRAGPHRGGRGARHPAGLRRSRPEAIEDDDAFERRSTSSAGGSRTRCARRDIADKAMFYIPSLSHRTIVYKGMLIAPQLPVFFPDLARPGVESALAMVHSRFSTNTFPSWERAHPYRYICPQRRDQHAARQRQLDARPREPLPVAAVRRRPRRRSCPIIDAARQRLRHVRQRAGDADPHRPLAARTR